MPYNILPPTGQPTHKTSTSPRCTTRDLPSKTLGWVGLLDEVSRNDWVAVLHHQDDSIWSCTGDFQLGWVISRRCFMTMVLKGFSKLLAISHLLFLFLFLESYFFFKETSNS
ncbi:uncharacterized protein B0J16DRAFT_408087 [Fusarium flagelliforme]|uniref:uncharacterized protein n=1 Tax=Fusarium flagelliforme TaxID=2675880 RepID=UPI001E8E4C90|nr:uncharacterized protein B0J16DRAFT_408087 [Fusarium flagelliforme]KAH7196331.1 hypothetical protein B0J16DRAFT_408087 [Fusarium flagelliforme]